jgi:hypothetical protein
LIAIKTLIFLEDAASIAAMKGDTGRHAGDIQYVSLSPSASFALDHARIPHKTLKDYGGGTERYEAGLENFRIVDRLVAVLDRAIAPLHAIPTLTPARYTTCDLKILFDQLGNTISTIKTVIDTERADAVCLYTRSPVGTGPGASVLSPDESIPAVVLGMNGWNVPVTIVNAHPDPSGQTADEGSVVSAPDLKNWLQKRDLLFNLSLIAKRNGTGRAAGTLLSYLTRRHRCPVLLYNSGYNWDDALSDLYRAGICPVYRISDADFRDDAGPDARGKNRARVRELCRTDPQVRALGTIHGIDAAAFLNERIAAVVGDAIGESVASYKGARGMIRARGCRCLLHSVRERPAGHAIVQAAHDEKIPAVSWQHGGAGYCDHPIMPFIEFINSDWHFVFGPAVGKSYRQISEKIGLGKIPVFIPTGSSSLEYFRASAKKMPVRPENPPVVYITTHFLNNLCPISQPCDPSAWNESIWDMQKQFMACAKRHPGRQFILKLHPIQTDREPHKSYLKENGIGNVELITAERSTRELTDIADILVFDLVSTGILQVLTSDRPVFIYSGLYRIDEEVIRSLQKRTCVADNPEELIRAIEEYLRSGQVPGRQVVPASTEFVTRYGTGVHDLPSGQVAATELRKIIGCDKNG